jgi:hypothetical protein
MMNRTYECEYCNKILKTKQNLDIHYGRCKVIKENNKLQKLREEKTIRENCQTLQSENEYLKEEIQKIKNQKQEEIQRLKDEKKVLDKEIEHLQLQNTEHKQQIEHLQNQLVEIAKTPKMINTHNTTTNNTTTNNNNQRTLNVVNQLAPYDLTTEKVQEILGEHTLEGVFIEGANGIADFVVEKILYDPKTKKPKLIATDRSRGVFRYKDDEGNIHVDHKLKRTADILQKPLLEASQQVGVDILHRGEMSENIRETFANNSTLLNCNNKHKLSSQLARRLVQDPDCLEAFTESPEPFEPEYPIVNEQMS